MKSPTRWRDDAQTIEPELRELMQHGHNLAPDPDQLARITASVLANVSAPSEPVSPKVPGSSSPMGIAYTKVCFWLAAALVGGALFNVVPWPNITPAEGKPATLPSSSVLHGAAPTTHSEPRPVIEPPSVPATEGLRQTEQVSVDVTAPEPRRRHGPAQGAQLRAAPQDEATILRSAKQLLTRDSRRSVVLALEHERHYPEGMLREEREALLIEAMWRLGREDEAKQRFSAFRERYPQSPYARRLAALADR